MRWSSVALVVLLAGCSWKAEQACKRLAPRLTPDQAEVQRFVEQCTERYLDDEGYARMVECLLDVEGGIFEQDIERCGGNGQLPMYFQF
jgi:hypothetical protein